MTVNHGVPGSSPGEGAQIKKRSFRPLFLFINHAHIRQTGIICGCIFFISNITFLVEVTTLHHKDLDKCGLLNQMEDLAMDIVVQGQYGL
jgi:hypothetical protein